MRRQAPIQSVAPPTPANADGKKPSDEKRRATRQAHPTFGQEGHSGPTKNKARKASNVV